MKAPWGNLDELDLDTSELILSADKHTLLECMIVESLFDQIAANVPESMPGLHALDIETVVVDRGTETDRWLAVVWMRSRTPRIGRFLSALESHFKVLVVEYEESSGFSGTHFVGGKREGPDKLLEPLSTSPHKEFQVDGSVRDATRQKRAIWGFLMEHYGKELAQRILLPRLLINCGVQPWFRAVWNLDRIYVSADDDRPWLFEVKHKFPYGKKSLKFGINIGELNVLRMLAACGVGVLHTILVKPIWSKDVGSLYLLNDLKSRDRAAVIGAVLDERSVGRIMARDTGNSGSDTTITGDGKGLS